MATNKELLEEIKKIQDQHSDHDNITSRLVWGFRIQNIVIGLIGVIGTILMFTLSQLIPLFLEIIKMD